MKIFLKLLMLISAVVIFAYLFFYSANILLAPSSGKVCFGKNCFLVELARTPEELSRGLMFRQQLDKNRGMLFIFNKEDLYPFWMKNTLIPLDIIWIKEDPSTGSGQVVFIKKNAEPCAEFICQDINPGVYAKYVLEVNAGISNDLDLKIGEVATFK